MTISYVAEDFLRDKTELDKMFKSLDRASQKALKKLLDIMNDTKADPKLQAQCATKLLDFYIEVAKFKNNDSFQRMIAQHKIGNGRLIELPGGPGKPKVDFDKIQDVN